MTNATELGPLQLLIGTWQGQAGKDASPEPDGTEFNQFREKLVIQPVRPFSNAEEQRLLAVQYHQTVHRIRDNKQIHDQTGYWSWDEQNQILMHSFTLARGMSVIAGGTATVDENHKHWFSVSACAEPGSLWPISQSPFLMTKAKTLKFEQEMEVAGSEMNYKQTTYLDIYGRKFEHTDENTLIRIG